MFFYAFVRSFRLCVAVCELFFDIKRFAHIALHTPCSVRIISASSALFVVLETGNEILSFSI